MSTAPEEYTAPVRLDGITVGRARVDEYNNLQVTLHKDQLVHLKESLILGLVESLSFETEYTIKEPPRTKGHLTLIQNL